MEKIFDKHWMSVFTDAVMFRLNQETPGPDSISISRQSFDDLIKITEVAQRLNFTTSSAHSIYITPLGKEGFRCVIDNPYARSEGKGRTLLEALLAAFEQFGKDLAALAT